jgi:Anti-sigma-28 factor, FlgM
MHAHGPSCLPGPITRDRDWWSIPAGYNSLLKTESARRAAPIRHHLVERLRREIAEGTYDTPEKLEVALERLLRQLDRD